MGGYERHCAPWSLDGIPADFNGKLLEEDWPRFEELMQNAIVRVPAARGDGRRAADQRPRGVHARREFILEPSDVRGFWVAAGFCARPRGRGRDGAARRRVDRRGDAVARRLAHGLAPLRRRVPLAAAHARADEGGLRDLLRREVPRPRARGRAAAPPVGRVSAARELGAAFGEKSGWERANWFERNAAAGDESLRPRGWAGKLWSPAIGAEHTACRETAALFDESSFAKIEVSGEAPAGSSRDSAPTGSRATSAGSPTRRCSTAAAGSSATSR